MKKAEVAAYFQKFEDAEKTYLDMDRRYNVDKNLMYLRIFKQILTHLVLMNFYILQRS